MNKDFPNTVFITGVSSGIGLALAERLLDGGATVYGCSRGAPEPLVNRDRMHFFPLDLADAGGGPEALGKALEGCPAPDLVVLNAGMFGEIGPCLDTPLDDLKRVMEVNLWANHWILRTLSKTAGPPAEVIAISSGAAVKPYAGWSAYNVSKAALNMFIAIVAQENPESHFVALAPGLVDTGMQDYLTSLPEDESNGPIAYLKEAKASGRMLSPDETAGHLIEWLPGLKSIDSGSFVDLRDYLAAKQA